ncbi:MAG TPA: D-hexose-6-phosphate mutarotase [Armatimonadota bacterium]|nr:D-hexose-6-phosphate mutarotase [Armatimonadota bacterium]HOM83227.1 D-hexose-6-phosphate mutarotase [Armatimonadota bacterium]HPO72535.1 D-hexose-6-phosphate mutarotase [Armatimonadota bacterium]HPT99162.1 D-hexose-6-phosphate mutarotase [Armatimonadota bacterium]
MLQALQERFGIEGAVTFVAGKNGLPTMALRHASGAGAVIYLHGAHVTSWTTPKGEELFFVSRESRFAPGQPIRGGIPVIFPQFGGGELPQHGFARISEWAVLRTGVAEGGEITVALGLHENPETLAMWPHPFALELEARLGERSLHLDYRAQNTGSEAFAFTCALHTYFRVADIRRTALLGLEGVTRIDTLRDDIREVETRREIRFDQETDFIYESAPDSVLLVDEGNARKLRIEKAGMPDYVVWNPWIEKSRRMPDFGDDEYPWMLCVETGVMARPTTLRPGEQWKGTTTFRMEA